MELDVLKTSTASDYLTEELIRRATDATINWDKEIDAFAMTFEILNNALGSNSFKKFNSKKGRFEGGFVVTAFEIIALGIGNNPKNVDADKIDENVKKVWAAKDEGTLKWAGRNTTSRLQITLDFGRKLFQK